jgi:hypothetical protein
MGRARWDKRNGYCSRSGFCGWIYMPYIFDYKGKIHAYGQFGNLKIEDVEIRFAKSPKWWIDNELAHHWLTEVYYPYSLK